MRWLYCPDDGVVMPFKPGAPPDPVAYLIAQSIIDALPPGGRLGAGNGLTRIHWDGCTVGFHETVAELFPGSVHRVIGPGPNNGRLYEYVDPCFPDNLILDVESVVYSPSVISSWLVKSG